MSDPAPKAGGLKPGAILLIIGAVVIGVILIGVAIEEFLLSIARGIGNASTELARRAGDISVAKLIAHDIGTWIATAIVVLLFIGWAAKKLRE